MRHAFFLTGAAIAFLGAAGAATPSGLTGAVTGGYGLIDAMGLSINSYDASGTANYAFDDVPINVQGFAGYNRFEFEGSGIDTWTAGGAVSWRDAKGAIGFFGSYNSLQMTGSDFTYYDYGLFSEWYPRYDLTLRLRGGAFSGEGASGAYGAGGGTYYLTPDLSLSVNGSYNNFGPEHWFEFDAGAEYLVFRDLPLSLGVGYSYTDYTGPGDMSALMVRLTYRLGETGSLVDLDRSGPLDLYLPRLTLL